MAETSKYRVSSIRVCPSPHLLSLNMRFGQISRALVLGAATVGTAAAQNDECVGALPLVVGANPYDTSVGATPSLPAMCIGTANDLWYTYAPSVAGALVTIETCVGTAYDSALEVYTGACGALTPVACNDDACALQSRVQFVANGSSYYVRVGGFGINNGAGVLTVTDVPVPNDECTGATPLAQGANPFDNLLATSSVEPWCGAISGGSDRWYTYTSTGIGNTITVNTCGSGFDTVLEVYTGACGALASVACNDDATIICAGTLQSAVTFVSPALGTVYRVRVGGFVGLTGTGVINVSDVAPPPTFDLAFTDCLPGTFLDISGTGTPLNLTDDGEVNITTTVGNALFAAGIARVGSNGGVRFGGAALELSTANAIIPASGAFGLTSQSLLPFWDDLNSAAGASGNIYWQEIAGTLYVQWQQVAFFNNTDRVTFQIQVPSSGPALARFIYTDIEALRATGGSSATIGYQSGGIGNTAMHSFNAHHAVRNGTVLTLVNRLAATTYMSSSVPGTWVDISGTGTALNLADDGEINIPTTVGNALLAAGTARVGSNGAVRFGGPGTELAFGNAAIPSSGAFGLTSQVAMPFWDDFNTVSGTVGNIYWQEIGDTLIVQWANVGFFGGLATDRATFQLQVFKGGPVVAQYLYQDVGGVRAANGASATIGYQAGGVAGNDVQWSFNTASIANGTVLSICYTNAIVGTRYCIPVANSTGSPANMYATGSRSLAANDLVLNVTDLPLNSFGYFVRGTTTANTLASGGGFGTLCVGGTVARGVGLAIVNSGATGMVSLPALLTTLPTTTGGVTVSATVGQVLWLQYWFRDFVAGSSTSNLSNALQVQVTM
jgi:hypothetical protein